MKIIKLSTTLLIAIAAASLLPFSLSSAGELEITSDNAPMFDDAFRQKVQQAFSSLKTVGSVGVPAIVRREAIRVEDGVSDIAENGKTMFLVRLINWNGEIRALALANEDASIIQWILLPPRQNPGA